jgi:hypothetical protein
MPNEVPTSYTRKELLHILRSIKKIDEREGELAVWIRGVPNAPFSKEEFHQGSFTRDLFSLIEKHLFPKKKATRVAKKPNK